MGQTQSGFVVKDSGQRQSFESGMMRDVATGKLHIWRVFLGPMLRRWARHVTLGAEKYPDVSPGVPNWTLATGTEELQRYRDSAARHFEQWMQGETDEDHAAAVIFNINGAEYVKERLSTHEHQFGARWDDPLAERCLTCGKTREEAIRPRLISKLDGTDTFSDAELNRTLARAGIGWPEPRPTGFPS